MKLLILFVLALALVAMAQTPAPTADQLNQLNQPAVVVPTHKVLLPEGTKVRVRLEQSLSSSTADQGQPVQLSVVEAVEVDGVEVIHSGASVHGTVTEAQPKRMMGRTGKLDFSIDSIVVAGNGKVPVRYNIVKRLRSEE